ncbi:MAG: hypothetical protein FD136_1322 [Chitinophagaceae bacterium]|nr:MAG: hypothetical protein FD183_573 [Chitinophagaceae bacterium]TXT32419.1 MAG: hypothetical protein FD136_1322 [Chitinophagaceae bacterium]
MGTLDKAIRVLVAILIGVLYFTGALSGLVATILLVLGGIFILTSFISFCPLYLPFGITTRPKSTEHPHHPTHQKHKK